MIIKALQKNTYGIIAECMSKESVLQSILQQKSVSDRRHGGNFSGEEILFLITGK